MPGANSFEYLPDGTTVHSSSAARLRLLYAPLCGVDGQGIKSAITPLLSGDIKIDKSRYLTKPASREDLRGPVRNFFLYTEKNGIKSAADAPDGEVVVELGQLWHKVTRLFPQQGLELSALTFVPVSGERMELTRFTVRNVSAVAVTYTPTAVVPIFARALANKHDHEHVTALLNRIEQADAGVVVEPTMLFNEEGHRPGRGVYYVFGAEGNGAAPVGTFPTVENFLGAGGDWSRPVAVLEDRKPTALVDAERNGSEAAGALRFATVTLGPGDSREYIVAVGMADSRESGLAEFSRFASAETLASALEENRRFWTAKTSTIEFSDGDKDFSAWMRWVTLQPILRRIFGCSFLPDHDYGKGGKGWRDIWQDLLSLILIEPEQVRDSLLNNFGGVRIDGSNATIIGQQPGEFVADRNAITRVWMDHGAWPFATTLLYINQTGDADLLFERTPYFVDPQMSRTMEKNSAWRPEYGNRLKDRRGNVYCGTVLEHILVQNLVQFFNVGEHNITRLESADWNDGLDMAFRRGESVAFMSFYAGNLLQIADLLERLAQARGLKDIVVAREVKALFDTLDQSVNYDDAAAKKRLLFEGYFKSVQPELSGETVGLDVGEVVRDLRRKGRWAAEKIRSQEMFFVEESGETFSLFNGYYDNDGRRVEGKCDGRMRMTLTGQVFPVMQGVASQDDIKKVVRTVNKYLRDRELGGFRLNTDFGVRHYLAMGRAFGFAFGTKENGAFFNHMSVMYAYALYKQNFAREGYEVLRSIYNLAVDGERAQIYPGIPEYFDSRGRGMYHFLTGSASWYILTLLTMAYGVRGELGDLVLAPRLVKEEFSSGLATVACQFAGRKITVQYVNPERLDFGQYRIQRVLLNGKA
ncbi:MAG: cellobiose phosphorylase, partial [Candidatus Omnitrophica bacterium]|nr:cellobiose phosphorylase [Candidatus Omnitrophota bacterium]